MNDGLVDIELIISALEARNFVVFQECDDRISEAALWLSEMGSYFEASKWIQAEFTNPKLAACLARKGIDPDE